MVAVSEPCQTTWFSYGRGAGDGNLLFQSRVKLPGSLTELSRRHDGLSFQSRVKLPGSLTLFVLGGLNKAFQSRVKSSGSLTLVFIARSLCEFQSRVKSLGLLLAPDAIARYFVSQPCQITWFSYASSVSPASEPFHSRVRSPGSLTDGYGCHLVVSQPCQTTWFSYIHLRRRCAAGVSEPRQIIWFFYGEHRRCALAFVSEPCRITWFSYALPRDGARSTVSEPRQTTWFSYEPQLLCPHLLFHSRVRSPGSSTDEGEQVMAGQFQSRSESSGSLARPRNSRDTLVFQSRAKLPGSLTALRSRMMSGSFQSRVRSPVSLTRQPRGGIVYYGFMAAPDRLVHLFEGHVQRGQRISQSCRVIRDLHGLFPCGSACAAFPRGRRPTCLCLLLIGEHSTCFAAVPNHLVFAPAAVSCRPSCFSAVPRSPSAPCVCVILICNAVSRCVALTPTET